MLLELAVGDAYGAGFEYVDADLVARRNDLSGYLVRHTEKARTCGRYTDDTQMSLAVAEAIVSGEPWTPGNLAARFVDAFHRDPRRGYASRFYDFLTSVRTGAEFLERIHPDSDKSGAAMRAAPIGVFSTVGEVLDRATIQARLTHGTPDGIAAACAAALMTHFFLYGYGSKRDLGAFLEEYVPGYRWGDGWHRRVGPQGWMSVRAAVGAVTAHDRLSDILRAAVAYTGDVDTVATIALAAASCSREVEKDLPRRLLDTLENGPYGRDYVTRLDDRLLALTARSAEAQE
jgi:ADP-ribosylglycohydrolase